MKIMEVIMAKNIKLMILGSLLLAPTITQPTIAFHLPTYAQMQNTTSTVANTIASGKVKAGYGWSIERFQYIPFKIGVGLDGIKLGFNFKGQDEIRFNLAKAVVAVLIAGYQWYNLPLQLQPAAATQSLPISPTPNAQ